jgi:hypothetical protein
MQFELRPYYLGCIFYTLTFWKNLCKMRVQHRHCLNFLTCSLFYKLVRWTVRHLPSDYIPLHDRPADEELALSDITTPSLKSPVWTREGRNAKRECFQARSSFEESPSRPGPFRGGGASGGSTVHGSAACYSHKVTEDLEMVDWQLGRPFMPRYMADTNETNRIPNNNDTTDTNIADAEEPTSPPKSTKWSALRRLRGWITGCRRRVSGISCLFGKRSVGLGSCYVDYGCCKCYCFGGLSECCGGEGTLLLREGRENTVC